MRSNRRHETQFFRGVRTRGFGCKVVRAPCSLFLFPMTRADALAVIADSLPTGIARKVVAMVLMGWHQPDLDAWNEARAAEDDGQQVRGLALRLRMRPIPQANRRAVLTSAKGCAECGARGPLTCDHVWPYSRGGSHAVTNLRALCVRCNCVKKDRV